MLTVHNTQRQLTIFFERFPAKLRSYEAHDALEKLLRAAIPEMTTDGLEGGMYGQTLPIWFAYDCTDATDARNAEIAETFSRVTAEFCKRKTL